MFQPEISTRTFKMMGKVISDTFLVPFHDLPLVLAHALLLGLIIAGFWLLDSLKDPILSGTVGMDYQPVAKLLSVGVTLFFVCLYDYLTSVVTKPSLFHAISLFFGIVFMILSALLSQPVIGLENRTKDPHRIIGWVSYFAIECYGSLMVALFWSFTNSIMNLEQAKGAYGLIITIAQFGAIIGSTIATQAVEIGIPQLFLVASVSILSISLVVKVYWIIFHHQPKFETLSSRVRRVTETEEEINEMLNLSQSSTSTVVSSADKPLSIPSIPPTERSFFTKIMIVFAGFYEGLLLIIKYPYVFHIFLITCLFEIILTILDYEFKILGAHQTEIRPDTGLADSSSDNFANLMGHFGQMTNVVSLVISFVGFSILVHRIGVRYTLLIFPIVMFVAVVVTNLVPSLWALFVMVSILKALVYSLNDPVVELLYMPTSEPIKFKAKAWIDVVGARSAKAIASIVTSFSGGDIKKLRVISEIPMILIALLFIAIVWITGREFDQIVQQKIIIGEELEHNYEEIQERIRREKMLEGRGGGDPNDERKRINGLLPGDVGYSGYDPEELFDGVDFEIYPNDKQQKTSTQMNSLSIPTLSSSPTTRTRSDIRPFQMENFTTPGSSPNNQSIWK